MTAATYNITADQGSTWNPTWTHKDSAGALGLMHSTPEQ